MTAIGLAVLAVALIGCNSNDSSTGKNTLPPSTTSTTPAASAAQEEALATYRGLWSAAVKAAATSDHQSQELRKYASYEGLAYFVGTILTNSQKGLVVKGEPKLAPHTTQVSDDKVTIADCLDDSRWLKYRASDGQLEDNVPGGHHRTEAVVTKSSIGWRVSKITVEGTGTC
ncbi:hypothetical protein ACFZBU_42170 [Embleya sp. NPDC008237]|uniref:hypothetical protein n=1 Tax=Embleya sp. NPDC008237 TaxID=3363978 RepID=UPI0036ECD77A